MTPGPGPLRHAAGAYGHMERHAAGDFFSFFLFFFFKPSGGWVKIKLKLPHFHVSDTSRVSI